MLYSTDHRVVQYLQPKKHRGSAAELGYPVTCPSFICTRWTGYADCNYQMMILDEFMELSTRIAQEHPILG